MFYGSSAQEYFGFAVCPGPVDLNRDGLPDAVIGTPSAENDKGAVFIRYGGKNGFAESPDLILTGKKTGDINQDGFAELAVTAFNEAGKGAVHLYYGKRGGIVGKTETVLRGDKAHDDFGAAVCIADMNRDGFDDLIVSATGVNGLGTDRGAVYVFFDWVL